MKSTIRIHWITCLLMMAGILVGPAGCIKIDATLSLNREGGGSLRTIYGMPTFLIKQMDLARQWTRSLDFAGGKSTNAPLPALDIPMIFDESILKARFGLMAADGMTLESLRVREQGGWQYVDFNLKFNRLEGLLKQSFFKDCGVVLTGAGGDSSKLVISLPPVGVASDLPGATSPDGAGKLTSFVNGLRVVVRIDLPGDIRNSTSMMSDGRRATWEWDVDKDAAVLERLKRDRIEVVFDGRRVRLKDFEKPAGGVAAGLK